MFGRRAVRDNNRGQSTVEIALLLPVLLIILLGVLDLGRAVYGQSVLSNAVREGARAAVVQSNSQSVIIQAVQSAAVGVNLPAGNISVTGPRTPGTMVTVAAWQTFTPVTPLISTLVVASIQLRAQSSMVVD